MPEEYGEVGDLVTCPSCGKIWPKGTKFCTLCGTWIETGQVLEPTRPIAQAPKPSQPDIGSGPPGIGPTEPLPGDVPPQSPRFRLGTVPSPPPGGFLPQFGLGPDAVAPGAPPGGMPGQPPAAPVAGAGAVPEAEQPKKKYTLVLEPRKEGHVPQGPMFIPKREERRRKKAGIKQVLIVLICLLAIGYAVISMAFKPLHGFLMGKAFELIGKPEQAMKYYAKAAGSDTMWAEQATKAMTQLAKDVVGKHLDLQFYATWTAKTKIAITLPTGNEPIPVPLGLVSSIWYRAPGFVSEAITHNGAAAGRRLLTDQVYQFQFGRWLGGAPSASTYSSAVKQEIGLTTSELFDKANRKKVLDVLFNDVGLEFQEALGQGENRLYQFALDVKDKEDRLRKLNAVMAPFLPLGQWRLSINRRDIVRVELVFLWKNGQLAEIRYLNDQGLRVAEQVFEDFQADASIDDSVFR